MCDIDGDIDKIDWGDWIIIGPLSEAITVENQKKGSLQHDNDELGDYWRIINKWW